MPFAQAALFDFDSDEDVDHGEWAFRNERAAQRKRSLQQARTSKKKILAEERRARKKLAEYRPVSSGDEGGDEEAQPISQQPSVASISSTPSTSSAKAHRHRHGRMYKTGRSKVNKAKRFRSSKGEGHLKSPTVR
jgi:hypothetical protein